MSPEDAMRLALAQGRRAAGRTFPNPSVGAVVFRGDRVLGRGRTRPVGGPHAETVAIDSAVRRHGARAVRGASMAVTLEPCCHVGRTGPCSEAITRAGLRRVYIGARDPHPEVAGRGLRRLRRGGADVTAGVLRDACCELHRGFFSVWEHGRPFVSLKLASTLDGRTATARGESRWITGPAARAVVQRLRARTDAVLVGSATVLADDPELVARRGDRVVHRPVRVVVDAQLRVPATARLFRGEERQTWVLCAASAPAGR
ncbi:MAG: bifunctional diaminohydroxyphosphoribosylaminopyrimidine deaminase/5-amino-6-(5-phosphoribosylamino)uracil reductase RibD, partial [Myxococcota bacterium]